MMVPNHSYYNIISIIITPKGNYPNEGLIILGTL